MCPAVIERDRGTAAHVGMHRQLRRSFAAAVNDGFCSIEIANSILRDCRQPELSQSYTVRMRVAFTCEVAATADEAAVDSALDAITDALRAANLPFHIDPALTELDSTRSSGIALNTL